MFVDMIIFAWLGYRYKGISLDEIKKAEEEEKALKDGKNTDKLNFKWNKLNILLKLLINILKLVLP